MARGLRLHRPDGCEDFTPAAGFTDDLGALAVAFAAVLAHMKPAHRSQAEERMKEWFGDD
jgi:uncharacterized membrane protein YkvA (DUF1232 family)